MQPNKPISDDTSRKESSLAGGCQCGELRYQIDGEPMTLYVCHCKDCQKQSSSAFGMSLWVKPEQFKLMSGKLSFYLTRGDSGALKKCSYCRSCGSRIYHCADQPSATLSIKAGSLDDTSRLQPIAHLWTRSAQPWIELDHRKYSCFETEPTDDQVLIRLWQQARL